MPTSRHAKPKRPKNARAVLAAFRRACVHGTPSYGAIIEAIEFLLRREAQKEKDEIAHERIAEDALEGCFDPYGGGR